MQVSLVARLVPRVSRILPLAPPAFPIIFFSIPGAS